ncbi:MAG: helix-turn-helix domain-containing protein [Oscillospiraceae bacterium]|nr:helix-turn-helix domain-containing protein [Oscillospiraceae bacterium]
MNFGNRLGSLIEERDITQKELAKQLNIAASTMSSYVQNTREPEFSTLKALAEYFKVSTDYLLGVHTGKTSTNKESELLRIFRSLSAEQQDICIEQCKVFVRTNFKQEAKSS